jgi:hypothetical protein
MASYLGSGRRPAGSFVTLEAGRLTLGTDPANDLPLPVDPTLSRLHAVLERYEAGSCARPGLPQRHLRQRPAHLGGSARCIVVEGCRFSLWRAGPSGPPANERS